MSKRVLIVDDEDDIRNSVKQLVESAGHETKTASSAKEALKILKTEKFDLVVMDIFMPEMSGTECVQEIRNDPKIKNQKIVFLTVAKLSESGKKIIDDLKPLDYINKPILDIEKFTNTINKLLK